MIFATTATTGGGVLFAFVLANFGCFVANLRTVWCTFTGLNNAVVTNDRYDPDTLAIK